mgnify:CR=1 FL=1|jgi:hypothetical protein
MRKLLVKPCSGVFYATEIIRNLPGKDDLAK